MFKFFKNKKNSKNAKPVVDKAFTSSDLILAKNTSVDLSTEHGNVMVIGGPGSGKTRYFVRPNLLQAHYSYIVTDCGGECFKDTSVQMQDNGYEIVVLNLWEPEKSSKYNPIEYIYSKDDAEMLAKIILGDKTAWADRFVYDVSVNFLTALLLLTKEHPSESERNLGTTYLFCNNRKLTMKMLDRSSQQQLSKACVAYETAGIESLNLFKLVSNAVAPKLEMFCVGKYKNVFCGEDDLKLNRTNVKRILYILIPPMGDFQTVSSMIYAQSILAIASVSRMFENMGRKFDHKTVMFMDDFSSTVYIPDFDKLLGLCKRHVCCVPILQSISQLKKLYSRYWEYIMDQIDMILYLGSMSMDTNEYIGKMTGMTINEVQMLPKDHCIVASRSDGHNLDAKYEY